MTRPRWLSVHRHRVRALRAPFLLVVQHHLVEGPTLIVAPIARAKPGAATLLVPRVTVAGDAFDAVLLNMAAVDARLILDQADDACVDEDAITNALDAIFRGYPVGLPYR